MTAGQAVANAADTKVIAGYPSLSREAAGALKLVWRLANIKDDWTKGGRIHDAWDRWTYWPYMAKVTYNLTFAVRMIAKFSQEIPAWREIAADAAEKLTDRMRYYVSWYDWVEQKGLDPKWANYPYFYYAHTMPPGTGGWYNAPGYAGNGLAVTMPGLLASLCLAPVEPNPVHPYTYRHCPPIGREYDPDPIRAHGSSNMMYKGYYLEQLANNMAISGNKKWDEPLHLIYDDEIQFTYTAEQISQVLTEQFISPMDPGGSLMMFGIDCEVGKVFPLCVGVAGLGQRLMDRIKGTNHVVGFEKWLEFAKTWVAGGNEHPEDLYTWAACYYDRDLNVATNLPQHQMPCFWVTPAFNTTPFETEWPEKLLKSAITKFGRWDDDALRLVHTPDMCGPLVIDDTWGHSFAMATAYELGDTETYTALRAWCDRAWEPIYSDGEFAYGFNLGEAFPRGIINHIQGLSLVGGPGSAARMYNEPNLKKFDQPTLTGVDYPNLAVRQAYYDENRHALALAITPGQDSSPVGSPTSLRVINLGDAQPMILEDGVKSDQWQVTGHGEIAIETTVDAHTFLVSLA